MSNTANANNNVGSCWSCVDDLTMPAVMVGGNRVVGEAIARRLTTPRGQNVGDPDYGFDLTVYLNADISTADISLIQSGIDAECVKDERVLSATSTVTLVGTVLIVSIMLTLATGPFTLVLSVNDVTVQILSVGP